MGASGYNALKSFYRSARSTHSAAELELGTSDPDRMLEMYRQAIAVTQSLMWDQEVSDWIDLYHGLYREYEALLQAHGSGERHHITVVIPVADRPIHLETCLRSLLELCRAFHYGGVSGKGYEYVSVMIADDSRDRENIQKHRQLAEYFSEQGLSTSYFGLSEQLRQLEELDARETESTRSILGAEDRSSFYHKGPSVMRNIAYLKLNEQQATGRLFYFIDSDQEFRVKVQTGLGEQDLYAVNYLAELDTIFSRGDVNILTGKVVGDPPVSPAVMAGNFLEDVISFLHQISAETADAACRFHSLAPESRGEAAYHDMAGLFGFEPSGDPYPYRCHISGAHDHARCLQGFATKLNRFFYGEHPTRKSFFVPTGSESGVAPARTIYTGNYVFNAAGLKYFIPFAELRLRMAGPVLGRLIKAEIGTRFVSANLPMLHKRTLEQTGQSEFRPGVAQEAGSVDLSDEFERQYYGDIMLFSMERLTGEGYPQSLLDSEQVRETVESTERLINQQYKSKHEEIMRKLDVLKALVDDDDKWWNRTPGMEEARQSLDIFVQNIERNYSPNSTAQVLVNSAEHRQRRLSDIADAIHGYPSDRKAWEAVLARHGYQARA